MPPHTAFAGAQILGIAGPFAVWFTARMFAEEIILIGGSKARMAVG